MNKENDYDRLIYIFNLGGYSGTLLQMNVAPS